VTIHTAKYGPIQLANLYQDVYASNEQKYCHLARIWDRLRATPGRPIIGGDFNMPPSKVETWTSSIAAGVLAPTHATYGNDTQETILDFSVAEHTLCMGQAGAESVLDAPLAPHRPVRLLFQAAMMSHTVLVYQPPKAGSIEPVCGPRRAPLHAPWAQWEKEYTSFWGRWGKAHMPSHLPEGYWTETQALLDQWLDLAHSECAKTYLA